MTSSRQHRRPRFYEDPDGRHETAVSLRYRFGPVAVPARRPVSDGEHRSASADLHCLSIEKKQFAAGGTEMLADGVVDPPKYALAKSATPPFAYTLWSRCAKANEFHALKH